MRFNSYEELISFIEREIAKARDANVPDFYSLKNALHNVKQDRINRCQCGDYTFNDYNYNGWQPALMLAAREGNLKMLDLFINEEAGHVNKYGTALTTTIFDDPKHACLQRLLTNDDEVRASQLDELMLCICKGDTEGAKRIILSDTPLTTDVEGNTALMYAAAMGHAEIVKLLIEHRGEECLRKQTRVFWYTALMYAVAMGHAEIVELLVPHEARMHDCWSQTALMRAAKEGNVKMAKLLVEEAGEKDGHDWTALMRAAISGSDKIVKLLVEKEAGMRDKLGRTALMHAIRMRMYKCIEILEGHEQGEARAEAEAKADAEGHE